MKVLHVIASLSAYYGGPSIWIPQLCRRLGDQGIETTIVTTNADGATNSRMILGAPISLGERTTAYYFERRPPWRYAFSWGLTRWLHEHLREYDLLHVHDLFSYSSVPSGYMARRGGGTPYVVTPHGVLDAWCLSRKRWRKRLYMALWERRTVEGAKYVHFTTEAELQSSQPWAKDGQSVVIPYHVEEDEMAGEHREPPRQHVILFLSRVDPKKGLEALIRAVSVLAKSRNDFVFVIAGDGEKSYMERIRRLVASQGLAERTVFTGLVSGGKKATLLRGATVFVLPSYQENFGIAVAEAMRAGVPVIISDRVNLASDVADAGAGLVVSLRGEELVRALERVLDDSCGRLEMGRNACSLAKSKYSWQVVVPQFIDLYHRALRK
jgi:glycosyltransferase involved in cell wall biosynthesis